MMRGLIGAIQFLTVMRIPHPPVHPAKAAAWFPLVGAAIGWTGYALFLIVRPLAGTSIAALIVVAWWALITGALHEDGLADVADAVRSHRTRDQIREIMKDPRVGAFGALALIISVLLRWQLLANLLTVNLAAVFVAAQAVPRAVIVALAYIARPAASGTSAEMAQGLSVWAVLFALLQGAAAAAWCGLLSAAFIGVGSLLIVLGARVWFERRVGGVNGDCLGATAQVVETYVLFVHACRNCIW